MRTRTCVKLALATTAITLLVGGTAQAATVRLGSTLQGPTGNPQYENGTLVLESVPAPGIAASPVDGTIVSWSFIGNDDGLYFPRVIRSAGAGAYTGVATGPGQNGAVFPAIAGPFSTNLPIRKGEHFGIDIPEDGTLGLRDPTVGGLARLFTPPLANNAPPTTTMFTYGNEEEMVGATVRYCVVPNLKGKSPKAARNALTAADCTVGKVKKTKKKRKKKKVLSQSVAPGTSISDTAPVDLKTSQKKK